MDGSMGDARMDDDEREDRDEAEETPGQEKAEEDLAARLDDFGRRLSESRKEAIDHRRTSGIEEEWSEDEDAYQGYDEYNRGENRTPDKGDPLGMRKQPNDTSDTRSTVVPNITGPYCDSAAARLADMILPVDEQPFEISPTPIPGYAELLKDTTPIVLSGPDGQPVESTRADYIESLLEAAKKPAKAAQRRISDWFVECKWIAEGRTCIEDASRIGTGVLKGPFPVRKKRIKWVKNAGFDEMQIEDTIVPASKAISAWDLFPSPSCGESIHNGTHIWERDRLTPKQLAALKGTPGYIDEQIDECLEEGPVMLEPYWTVTGGSPEPDIKASGRFQVWYYTGTCSKEDWVAAQPIPGTDEERERFADALESMPEKVSVCATIVNHRCIKAARNYLDNGAFPYDIMVWRKRKGMPWGQGIARLIRTPQRMLTAAVRNLMDNAGLGGGPIITIDPDVLQPHDGKWSLYARKFFLKVSGATMAAAKDAIDFKTVPLITDDLLQIIHLALRFAEETTGLPAILQGQMGEKAPDRVGIVKMLEANGSSSLRRLARLMDERVTAPHVERYYVWLMQYGEDPAEKGDFYVQTKGSTVLIERGLQNEELGALLPLSLEPRYELDPAKIAEEYLRSRRFDPSKLKMDEDQLRQQQEQQNPLALAEAALKKAEAALKEAQARKTDAETIEAGIRAQYTAVQTAGTVVANPAIAPVGDAVIRNAADGLTQQDTLPQPAVAVPGAQPAVQTNTSPALPPVPAQPGSPAGGIETQRQEGAA